MMFRCLCVLSVPFLFFACRDDDPAARADRRQRQIARHQCEAGLSVYLPGQQIERPYRVIGPIEVHWGWTVQKRFARMRREACEMGADAIIDAQETYVDRSQRVTTVQYDAFGRPIVTTQTAPNITRQTTAIAIKFINPPSQAAPMQPSAPAVPFAPAPQATSPTQAPAPATPSASSTQPQTYQPPNW